MTPDQMRLIRASFCRLLPNAERAAALFYANLFAADASLQALFKGDMAQQGTKLMQMIGSAIGLLDKPLLLVPVLRNLGRRHVAYGVRPAHFDSVGAALMKTLSESLGSAFDADTRAAWAAMYAAVSATMIEAAATTGDETLAA